MKQPIQSILNLFRPRQVRLEVERVKSTEIRLDQWRKTPNLVTAAAKVHADPTYRMMIDCLQSEHPCHIAMAALGTNPSDRMALQSKTEGFELALNMLAAMSAPYKISKPLEATFEPPQAEGRK